jgi:hypothetical protein
VLSQNVGCSTNAFPETTDQSSIGPCGRMTGIAGGDHCRPSNLMTKTARPSNENAS